MILILLNPPFENLFFFGEPLRAPFGPPKGPKNVTISRYELSSTTIMSLRYNRVEWTKTKLQIWFFTMITFVVPKFCTIKSKTRLFSDFVPNLELSQNNGVWKWLAQHMAGMAENRYFLHIFRKIVKKKKKKNFAPGKNPSGIKLSLNENLRKNTRINFVNHRNKNYFKVDSSKKKNLFYFVFFYFNFFFGSYVEFKFNSIYLYK